MAPPEDTRPAPTAVPPVLPAKYWFPLLIALFVSGAILVVSELTHRQFSATRGEITQGMAFQTKLQELEKTLFEAIGAQRGYLLTRKLEQLQPFQRSLAAIRPVREQLRDLVGDKATREKLADLNELITLKFAELERALSLANSGDFEGARSIVEGDDATALSNKLHDEFDALSKLAADGVNRRAQTWEDSMDSTRTGILAVVALNATLIAVLALVLIRDTRRARAAELAHVTLAEKMKREVSDRTQQLSSLSEFLQTQSELEKARLARELHDELGGILTPAKMDVNWLEGRLGSDNEVSTRLERLTKLLDSGIDVKRRIIENLRPSTLDHLGLVAALRAHIEETCKAANLDCRMALAENLERMTPDIEIALYRVVQESLTNIIRHAQAKRVDLAVERTSDGIVVVIRDDGQGIPDLEAAQRKSYGIGGIRQRLSGLGGSLEIDSGADRGTNVRAFVPLKPQASSS